MNLNRVLLAGNLTRDPETRATPTGATVTSFGLAINRKWKDSSGEPREEVCFVDCDAWGRVAEVIGQHFGKGSPIFVEGRLQFRQWDDKSGGGKRSKLSVTVESFQFVERKAGDGGGGGGARASGAPARTPAPSGFDAAECDEIPF